MATKNKDKATDWCVVTTEWRGIFVGRMHQYDPEKRVANMVSVRNVIWFGGREGFLRLAAKGPISEDRLGVPTEMLRLERVTSVAECSHEAVALWEKELL